MISKGFETSAGEVHVWWASLDVDDAALARLEDLLDGRELERANRFRVARARRRFIAARAALRSILGAATGTEPGSVRFAYGEHGKPTLADGGPCFNASDSGDFVAVALAANELGVDVERVRPVLKPDRLALRICTDGELEQLVATPDHELEATLLRLWTFKEAALKAIGVGLPGGLRNVEVDFPPGKPPRLRRLLGDHEGWSLMTPEIGRGILCSIVLRGVAGRPNVRELSLQSR